MYIISPYHDAINRMAAERKGYNKEANGTTHIFESVSNCLIITPENKQYLTGDEIDMIVGYDQLPDDIKQSLTPYEPTEEQ